MLYDLYVGQEKSFMQMEKIIGFSRGTIRQKIEIMKIPVRSKGGANNPWGLRRKPENRLEGSKWYPYDERKRIIFNPAIKTKRIYGTENQQTTRYISRNY